MHFFVIRMHILVHDANAPTNIVQIIVF